jgi:hypothetical protein
MYATQARCCFRESHPRSGVSRAFLGVTPVSMPVGSQHLARLLSALAGDPLFAAV